jgi:spore germination cell wall hydrolase CwlJ-like protein
MVRIVPHLNQPFNTKMRAPFKMVCETVRYRELQDQESRRKLQDNLFNQSPREDAQKTGSLENNDMIVSDNLNIDNSEYV